jgi:O-antigen/teichoic acid export membrane protein
MLNVLKVLVLPAKLQATDFGAIVLAVSYTTFFGIFVSLGTSPYLVRAVARDPSLADSYISNALALRLVMAAGVFALLLGIAALLGYPPQTVEIFFIIGLQMSLFTISNVFESGLQALGQMTWKAIAVAIAQISATLLGVTLLLMGADVITYAWSLPLGMALQLVLVLSYYFRRHPIKFSFDTSVMRGLLIGGIPLFIWGFLQTAYGQIDATVLSLLTDKQNNAVVGWFGAAGQITNVLIAVPAAISAVAMPILCSMYIRSESDFNRTSIRTLVTTLLILMPVGAGLAVASADVIRFLPYKPEFINAAPALSLMALAVPMTGLLMVLATMAVAIGQEKQWVKISAFAVCIFPPLYVGLIWWFQHTPAFANGATGAALANLVGETALVIWAWLVLPAELRHKEVVHKGLQIGALTLIMVAVVFVLQRMGMWLFGYITVGGLIYIVGAWLLRLVTPGDLQVVRNALLRRRRPVSVVGDV